MAIGKLKLKRHHRGFLKDLSRKRKDDNDNKDKCGELDVTYETEKGIGLITSRDVDVQGYTTKFIEQVDVGDELVVTSHVTEGQEVRTVAQVVSDRVLRTVTPFAADIIAQSGFQIRKVKKSLSEKFGEQQVDDHLRAKMQKEVGSVMSVRRKLGNTYKVQDIRVNRDMSAEDKLDLRVKMTGHDKFC